MAVIKTGGYGHRIRYLGLGVYELSWSHDIRFTGVRHRTVRAIRRDTDRRGAERFARKCGCAIPETR